MSCGRFRIPNAGYGAGCAHNRTERKGGQRRGTLARILPDERRPKDTLTRLRRR